MGVSEKNNPSGFRNPHNLPSKICLHCSRPFVWRKKWRATWDAVQYCSDACRKNKHESRR
ncbi:MAG: DUF2256 domain-containing protein [Burkholderiales bacterium]|nr:DUF2256 domain-containing protein [Burkholderiales bacterium]